MEKKLLILFTILGICSNSIAQNKIEIPIAKNAENEYCIDLSLNGKEKPFIIRQNSGALFISSDFLKTLNLKSSAYMKNATVFNDSLKINTEVYKIDTLSIKDSNHYGIEVFSNKQIKNQSIGLNYFKKIYDKVSLDTIKNVIILEQQQNFQTINNIKFIPCESKYVSSIPSLQDVINGFLKVNTYSQENNIPPPPNAVARVNKGITIRYFETKTKEQAKLIKNNLQKDSAYVNTEINVENMLPYIPNQIRAYIEIWIK